MHLVAILAAAALALAACGGGGGSGEKPASMIQDITPPEQPVAKIAFAPSADGRYRISGLVAPQAADAKHMPIYRDNTRIAVGIEQPVAALRRLPSTDNQGGVEILYGLANDGVGRATINAYLTETGRQPYSGTVPIVRLIGDANARDATKVIKAVQLLNASLPEAAKVSIGESLPTFSLRDNVGEDGRYYRSGTELADVIHIEFVPQSEYRRRSGSAAVAYDLRSGSSYIQFNMGASSYPRDHESMILLIHELMHAVADFSHVSSRFATIMEGTGDIHHASQNGEAQPLSLLYPIDREALRANSRAWGHGRALPCTLRAMGSTRHLASHCATAMPSRGRMAMFRTVTFPTTGACPAMRYGPASCSA